MLIKEAQPPDHRRASLLPRAFFYTKGTTLFSTFTYSKSVSFIVNIIRTGEGKWPFLHFYISLQIRKFLINLS